MSIESSLQKPFALILFLGFFLLSLQRPYLVNREPPQTSLVANDNQLLLQVATQHPYLLFQPIPINSADAHQLLAVSGIGPELARRIVTYRADHGPFRTLEELTRVEGIGPQKLAQLKTYCRL